MSCQRAVCSHRKVEAKGFGKCQLKRDSNDLGLATEGNLQRRDRTILNNEQNDFHKLIKNTLPNNFNEDSLICASQPGKTSGSCPGDSGGIFMQGVP